MTETVKQQTERLFQQFKNGEGSVRELAKKNCIPFTTLRDRFRKYYGQTYRHRAGSEGSITAIIKEHIQSLTGNERKQVELWWEENKERIYERAYQALVNSESKLFSQQKLDRDSLSLCRLNFDLSSSPFLSDTRYCPTYEDEDIPLVWDPVKQELVPAVCPIDTTPDDYERKSEPQQPTKQQPRRD